MEYGCAVYGMHTVNWLSVFERQAKAAGLGFDDIFDIAATIAMNPLAGDLIVGSGGARKLRRAGRARERAAATALSTTSRAKMCRYFCWR
jgi:hypothetical protein